MYEGVYQVSAHLYMCVLLALPAVTFHTVVQVHVHVHVHVHVLQLLDNRRIEGGYYTYKCTYYPCSLLPHVHAMVVRFSLFIRWYRYIHVLALPCPV